MKIVGILFDQNSRIIYYLIKILECYIINFVVIAKKKCVHKPPVKMRVKEGISTD